MQLFGIFVTIATLSTGHVDHYGPGACMSYAGHLCGPYAYYADCEKTAAQGRILAAQYYKDAKVTVTCAPIKQQGTKS